MKQPMRVFSHQTSPWLEVLGLFVFVFGGLPNVTFRSIVKGSMAIATPKRWRIVRGHDKPRLMGVAPSTFKVV